MDSEAREWFPLNATMDSQNPHSASTAPPRLRMICFHGAGSDSGMFTSKGTAKRRLPNPLLDYCIDNGVEVFAVHLPGRTMRFRQKMATSVVAIVSHVFSALQSLHLDANVPLVLVGHSMGAMCAFELACLLRNKGYGSVRRLVLSCMVSPDTPSEQRPWRPEASLDSEQLKEECRLWGINAEVFQRDVWALYEPILRADFRAMDTYDYEAKPDAAPLRIPTTLCFATADRRIPKLASVDGWKRVIVGPAAHNDAGGLLPCQLEVVEIPGGHNFFYEPEGREAWMQRVIELLDNLLLDLEYGSP